MTLVDDVLERARAYPDRPAIICADGTVTLYGDLEKRLPVSREYAHRTSGTTGSPKNIVISDDNLRKRLARLEKIRGPAFGALTSLFSPLPDTAPLGMQVKLHMLLKGGTLFTRGEEFDSQGWLDMCAQHQVAGIIFIPKVPPFWKLLEVGHAYRFPHVYVSGGAASIDEMERLRVGLGDDLYVNYAASEVGQIAGGSFDAMSDIPGCVGAVADDLEVEIDNGQVRVRAETMVAGYVDDDVLTAERFTEDGWFYPGDLGHFEKRMLVIDGRG